MEKFLETKNMRKRKCFVCNKIGHISKNCPLNDIKIDIINKRVNETFSKVPPKYKTFKKKRRYDIFLIIL